MLTKEDFNKIWYVILCSVVRSIGLRFSASGRWFLPTYPQTLWPQKFGGGKQNYTVSKSIMKVKVLVAQSCQLFETPWTVAYQVPLSVQFSRQEYCSGCLSLLQWIFLTQGLNPHILCLLHCRQILYLLSHQGSPKLSWTLLNEIPK